MTTRYRVEYALKSHDLASVARTGHERMAEVMRDVEGLVRDHIAHSNQIQHARSKLRMLVPTIGTFFTPLALEDAFRYQDSLRAISSRRFVPPSFNDVRLILNTAQVLSLVVPSDKGAQKNIDLITFDGDVTLYDDGGNLDASSTVLPHLLHLLASDIKIGIVTAAGYTDPSKYHGRLGGLLDAVAESKTLSPEQKKNLVVMGGESNFLFTFDINSPHRLRYVRRRDWILPSMRTWSETAIQTLLDTAQIAFKECIDTLNLPAQILRKERAVGIYPQQGRKLTREQLEETVLVVQQVCEAKHGNYINMTSVQSSDTTTQLPSTTENTNPLPFCAFNGGNDCFVDVGDKSLGVQVLQQYFGGIDGSRTLHVGDQFLSGGGNDFKARQACTTAWIASPTETVSLLEEIIGFMECRSERPGVGAVESSPTVRRLRAQSGADLQKTELGW
ncbi:MAG: hypothetical protein Q9227_007059 [Pyrenula ochraceoflavens]